jgi:hypothetical protein
MKLESVHYSCCSLYLCANVGLSAVGWIDGKGFPEPCNHVLQLELVGTKGPSNQQMPGNNNSEALSLYLGDQSYVSLPPDS